MEKTKYQELVNELSPNSKIISNTLKAFLIGGLFSIGGQFILNTFKSAGIAQDSAATYTSIVLIFIGVLLTGLGLYQRIGKFAGAGSAVPITGFANAVASPAIEFKKEGHIMGVGARMFILAGPVIVFGTFTSMIVGVFYYFSKGGLL
ncbi:MAG: stage V sporulation protein AC [Defluviitaleaceae bacterium]|nr:stage V sporulation protein AC [Defluviitaleaceae bacterium]